MKRSLCPVYLCVSAFPSFLAQEKVDDQESMIDLADPDHFVGDRLADKRERALKDPTTDATLEDLGFVGGSFRARS